MRKRFVKGMTAGAILGAAAGMMVMPNIDRKTRKRLKRSGKMIRNSAEDMYDNMSHWMKK